MEAYDVNQSNSEEKTDNDKTDQSFDDSTNRTVDNSNHFPSQNYSGKFFIMLTEFDKNISD